MADQDLLHFKLVTPQGVTYDDVAVKVTIPTEAGDITVYPKHIVLISTLKAGQITIHKPDGEVYVAVSNGVLQIRPDDQVYVLADTAEHAEDIDVARAEEARDLAEELLKSAESDSNVEYARIQAQIEKELVRIHVGNRYRNVK